MENQLYLKKIKDKVDDLVLKYGFGEIEFKLTVKDRRVLFIEWNEKGKEKVDIR